MAQSWLDRINPVKQISALFQLPAANKKAADAENAYQQQRLSSELGKSKDMMAAGTYGFNPPAATPTKTSTSSGGGAAPDPSQAIINSSLKKLNELYGQLANYKPASFDEALARQSVTTQTDAFYKSRVDEFLKGVDLQRNQSAETEKQTLEQLTAGKERYQASEAQQYSIAKEEALNSVVGSGRNLSGFGGRQLGQQEALRTKSLQDFLAGAQEKQSNIQLQGKQFGERLDFNKLTQVGGYDPNAGLGTLGGEYGRDKALAIESGVVNRRSEFTQEELRKQQIYNEGINTQIGGLNSLLGGYGL